MAKRKRSGIDWRKTPCCGARTVKRAGLWVCADCGAVQPQWGLRPLPEKPKVSAAGHGTKVEPIIEEE